MTTFSTLSDLVNITPVKTPMHMYLHHRTFRCFRVGGTARFVSLIPPAGPACQPHILLLPTRTAALGRPLHRRRRACAHRSTPPPLLVPCAAAPPPLTRRSATDRAPTRRLSRAPAPRSRRPVPRLRRLQAADRAPPSPSSSPACTAAPPAQLLPIARAYKPNLSSFHPLPECTPSVRGIAS